LGGIHECGRRNKEINSRIGKANAVLRELYCIVVTERELSNTAKLSVFNPVFVLILTYGHDLWVITERVLSSRSGRDGIFAKSSRRDTSRHSVQL